jgi:hypothetical protein
MPSFRSQLPSKSAFYRATDFDNGPKVLTIAGISTENLGEGANTELKLVASFREPGSKKLVLNLARAEAIADLADTEDTNAWVGVAISMRKGVTRYQGQRVACMVVEAPAADVELPESVGF